MVVASGARSESPIKRAISIEKAYRASMYPEFFLVISDRQGDTSWLGLVSLRGHKGVGPLNEAWRSNAIFTAVVGLMHDKGSLHYKKPFDARPHRITGV